MTYVLWPYICLFYFVGIMMRIGDDLFFIRVEIMDSTLPSLERHAYITCLFSALARLAQNDKPYILNLDIGHHASLLTAKVICSSCFAFFLILY
jgi:hypothetical protein